SELAGWGPGSSGPRLWLVRVGALARRGPNSDSPGTEPCETDTRRLGAPWTRVAMDSGRHGRGPPSSCHRAAPTAQLPPCSCALNTSTRWKLSELNYARGPPRANCAAPTVAVAHRHRCPPPPLPTATAAHRHC